MSHFRPATRAWFAQTFGEPTPAQAECWPPIQRAESVLLAAPTGSGKTLAAFLACIDRLMFEPAPAKTERCRVLYISPLKALAIDVERNLRAPIAGVARVATERGDRFVEPEVWVRTGDTPQKERARFIRRAADIVITTPESLYLMLTSQAAAQLRSIDTVIIDEIHALVPSKRGAHLMLSLERLEALAERRVQRIGLSATQRPLEEVARFLGGGRKVTIVDASAPKRLDLRIESALEDLAGAGEAATVWAAIHTRLLDLVRAHRSTLIFVNSRRLAERLAGALNELAGEALVYAHHGSIARPQRVQIEEKLKAGEVRALVATSSLELGIDMGAIDLVVQIEAPPSVASGLQRIGRAGHQVGGTSKGVVFPKFKADLVACAALTQAMREGLVEPVHYPRNPLDVLAQQIVAMVALQPWPVADLFARVRRAASFADLQRTSFDGVLDMLSGRYASTDFSDLKPRVTWDRISGVVKAREGARTVAVTSGGTIPDRGLYGVYLAGAAKGPGARVGELDEEMVFETKPGETFILGASTWRVEEITHDRVMVSPAPGQPGKMPFWRGDQPMRPFEVGARIGAFTRELLASSEDAALQALTARDLDRPAAENLLAYLRDQRTKGGAVPDDRTVVIERNKDELGAWRVCVMTPFGGQLHLPWSIAVARRIEDELSIACETMWTNEGFVVRLPEHASDGPPDVALFLPPSAAIEALLVEHLGATALFAARFRENAARALLLPRRRAGARTPLWMQRKRAHDLLTAAAQHREFPILLETYRECLRDVFDMPALRGLLARIEQREVTVVVGESATPSPFAAALLFGYVANYLYDGDAPLAERRAQALQVDQAHLGALLGEADLRGLLDVLVIAEVVDIVAQRSRPIESADQLHDLLLRVGDSSLLEIDARGGGAFMAELGQRIVRVLIAGDERWIAAEDAGLFASGLGVVVPGDLPAAFLSDVPRALAGIALRYARTHGPFTIDTFAARYGIPRDAAASVLRELVTHGRLVEGDLLPGGNERELCDPDVLAQIRRRSLQKLRKEIEPVAPDAFARLLLAWHGVGSKRRGLDALLDVIEQLQGAPLIASTLEREILPARLAVYSPADLDAVIAAGEVIVTGVETLGDHDGRVSLFLTDALPRLFRAPTHDGLDDREQRIVDHLRANGASFFAALVPVAGGFAPDTLAALWRLFFKGVVTNDTFRALRTFMRGTKKRGRREPPAFRSRRAVPPTGDGRWSLVETRALPRPTDTEHAAAWAEQLLRRYGVVTREVAPLEGLPTAPIFDVLARLEEQGRARRGYFVSGVAAMQLAMPAAVERLRTLRAPAATRVPLRLAATDPANPYGALLPWPTAGLARSAGASVVLIDGVLAAYLARGGKGLHVFVHDDDTARALAEELVHGRERLVIVEINGAVAAAHPFAKTLVAAGFVETSLGLLPSPPDATAERPVR